MSSTAQTDLADDDDLLTTDEASLLIGVSRQHVVDLAMRGDLPYETVGTHRRIRRAGLERLRYSTSRMSADQRRALRLGYATAGRLAEHPERALAIARQPRGPPSTPHPGASGHLVAAVAGPPRRPPG
jgi:excisionase family DNA binding protein